MIHLPLLVQRITLLPLRDCTTLKKQHNTNIQRIPLAGRYDASTYYAIFKPLPGPNTMFFCPSADSLVQFGYATIDYEVRPSAEGC